MSILMNNISLIFLNEQAASKGLGIILTNYYYRQEAPTEFFRFNTIYRRN